LPPNRINLKKRPKLALAGNCDANKKSFCKRLIFITLEAAMLNDFLFCNHASYAECGLDERVLKDCRRNTGLNGKILD
jgi:hypothetical protein